MKIGKIILHLTGFGKVKIKITTDCSKADDLYCKIVNKLHEEIKEELEIEEDK